MVGGWVGHTYCLFIYYIFILKNCPIFLIKFFWLPNFLSNLKFSQNDHLMVNKKTTNQVGHVQINLSSMTKWSN